MLAHKEFSFGLVEIEVSLPPVSPEMLEEVADVDVDCEVVEVGLEVGGEAALSRRLLLLTDMRALLELWRLLHRLDRGWQL